jgi:hypothetical protein
VGSSVEGFTTELLRAAGTGNENENGHPNAIGTADID